MTGSNTTDFESVGQIFPQGLQKEHGPAYTLILLSSSLLNHEIRNICCFKSPVYTHGKALYSHQKQDLAQIMNSLLPNSDLN